MSPYLHRGKAREVIDLSSAHARDRLSQLVSQSDAIIEDWGPAALETAGLTYDDLKDRQPGLVVTSISPFGLDGPCSGWEATEIVVQALGGIVAATGWEDSAPVVIPGDQAAVGAGLTAASVTLAALLSDAPERGDGVHIDLSAQESFAHYWTYTSGVYPYIYGGQETVRETRERFRHSRLGIPYRCQASDGEVVTLMLGAEWRDAAVFLGLTDQADDPDWAEPEHREIHADALVQSVDQSFAGKTRYDWFREAAAAGFTFAPVDDLLSVIASPQLANREALEWTTTAGGQRVLAPRLPFTVSEPSQM